MTNLSDNLLLWYKVNKRDFPWRRIRDSKNPYFVWLSEIMLQQTNSNTVIRYYKKFIYKWPTIQSLSKAKIDEVLYAWQGLGFYNRAINLHRCSKIICKDYNGKFPKHSRDLLALPGIGKYTAEAISSIAFNKRTIGIDVNVSRVISRVFNLEKKKDIEFYLQKKLPKKNCSNFMQAIMDLGATICKKNKINCEICPIIKHCNFNKTNVKGFIPNKQSKKFKKKFLYVYLIEWKNKILFKKRKQTKFLNGLMEIPGSCLFDSKIKMINAKEFAPVQLEWNNVPGIIKYNISNYNLEIRLFRAVIKKNLSVNYCVWVDRSKIKLLSLSTMMKKVLEHLKLF